MSWEMKNACMVLTISIEIYKEIGTMFWNAMRQDLKYLSIEACSSIGKTYANVMKAFTMSEELGSEPGSNTAALVPVRASKMPFTTADTVHIAIRTTKL